MDQITFDFLTLPEFRRGFPDARPPITEMPTESRDGALQLLEANQGGKYYVFLVRDERRGQLWSRRFRAFFSGLPASIVVVHVSADAKTRQQARERLQWHFVDVTAPEDDFPEDRGHNGGRGTPVPHRPVPPTRSAGEKKRPEQAA